MPRRWRAVIVTTLLLLFGGERLPAQAAPPADSATAAQLFHDVMRQITERYVDSVSPAELYDAAARAMVKHLHDRYSALLAGEAANMWAFGGIGARVNVRRDSVRIAALFPGSPAEKADIRPGDRIIAVGGRSAVGWTLEQIVNALRGEVGTQVAVVLHRNGVPQPIALTLTRAKVEIEAVQPGVSLADGIGYVALDAITPTAAGQLKDQVAALVAKGMRALILDLRRNGGGDLGQSAAIADLFLDDGSKLVSTRGRVSDANWQYDDEAPQLWPNLPIVVLVSSSTASGAEVITSALQDHDRVVVLGRVTFGKGVGQSQQQVTDRIALKLTTLRWYTPTGRNISRAPGDTAVDRVPEESEDSALRARPLSRTLGGRQIRGGSGLVPDLIVRPTPGERALRDLLGPDDDPFASALLEVALDLKRRGVINSEEFALTPAMRDAVYQAMQREGKPIPRKAFAALDATTDQRLRHEIASSVFGPGAALRYDAEVQLAIGLLRKAKTPQDLLRLGTSEQGYSPIEP